MKIIYCNGRVLEVRDAGPVIYRLRAGPVPIKVNGYQIMDDDSARNLIRALRATGLYSIGDSTDEHAVEVDADPPTGS